MTSASPAQWMPTSPCGPGCLPRPDDRMRVGVPRRATRLAAGAVMLLLGALLVSARPLLGTRPAALLTRYWFLGVLRAFGVRLLPYDFGHEPAALSGERDRGTLVVTNHVSWLDVVALQALCPMRMLAKTEVRSWPLLGTLAARAGTLFITRGRLAGLLDAVERITEVLRSGSVVGAFPEGTTWCGRSSGSYRPAVFQAAVDAGARVQPVALRFRARDGSPSTAAAFVGESTLLRSVWEVARTRGLRVELAVLPEVDARLVDDRRELARRCETLVTAATRLPGRTAWTWTAVEVAGSSGDHDERASGQRAVESTAA